ncbi:MAG: hypothetical protein M1832_001010 [Thelocarpon impressellum]|nr:MAG: hypothetical protein M1832_001010 [Thelocarpon impressellum]
MSGFTVPFASSTPTTPDSHDRPKTKNPFGSPAPNPSTTPAGPPPSSARSFTPSGPPPSSVFGSTPSNSGMPPLDYSKPLFGSSFFNGPPNPARQQEPSFASAFAGNGTPAKPSNVPPRVMASSPPLQSVEADRGDEDNMMAEDEGDEDAEDDPDYQDEGDDEESSGSDPEDGSNPSDDLYDDEDETEEVTDTRARPDVSMLGQSQQSTGSLDSHNPFYDLSAGLAADSRSMMDFQASHTGTARALSSTGGGVDSVLPAIAREYALRTGPATIQESGDLILGTEELVSRLFQSLTGLPHELSPSTASFTSVVEGLIQLWQSSRDEALVDSDDPEGSAVSIGPAETSSSTVKATFLSSLLLQIHHPPTIKASNSFSSSRASRSFGFSQSFNARAAARPLPLPKVLLDWLNAHHNPYPSAISDLQAHHPNPTNHSNFWDIILSSVLRGKLDDVIRILKETDFRHATPSIDDVPNASVFGRARSQTAYSDVQLGNIRRVINRAIQVLQQCPAVTVGDWDVRGSDWIIFRLRVAQATEDLTMFAEGSDRDAGKRDTAFTAEHFGISANASAMTDAARKAESKIPWTIYQNLKTMYGMLVGGTTELLTFAQDWAEAAVGLTAWWDGAEGALDLNRSNYGGSLAGLGNSTVSVDGDAGRAYLRRLAWSFKRATTDADENPLQVNTLNMIEVGLASIFEGDVKGAVGILRSWSLPIACAVAEVAGLGGWFDGAHREGAAGLDRSDLMVLSYGQEKRDELDLGNMLTEYAEGLFELKTIRSGEPTRDGFIQNVQARPMTREGWELGIQILGRLDDVESVSQRIGGLLDLLPLDSSERVDKLLAICTEINLGPQAQRIAEKYADSLAEGSYSYGEALVYYARAHKQRKLKNVLDLLISFCLVQSLAYPPESELDPQLRQLVSSPEPALLGIAEVDFEAAELLHAHLSGYATIRRFYELRDEVTRQPGRPRKLHENERKQQAATALVAVISSASDNITGGLYDEDGGAVVSVDGLLALLGEAMVLVDRPERILSLAQIFTLLRAIEDLQTVTPRVYAQCEEFFQSAVASAHGSQVSSPRATLKKTMSSMTASSGGFSLLGSSMMLGNSHSDGRTGGSIGSSGVLVKTDARRGWDWRTGLAREAKGDSVLRMLRLGLAREVGRAWLDGDDAEGAF